MCTWETAVVDEISSSCVSVEYVQFKDGRHLLQIQVTIKQAQSFWMFKKYVH